MFKICEKYMYFCWRGSQEGCTYSEICHLGQHYRSTHARQFESNRVSVVGASLNRADSSFNKQFGSGPCPCLHCKGACTRQGGERADRRPNFSAIVPYWLGLLFDWFAAIYTGVFSRTHSQDWGHGGGTQKRIQLCPADIRRDQIHSDAGPGRSQPFKHSVFK